MALLQIAECTAMNQDSGKQGERNSHWLKYNVVDCISETSLKGMAGSRYFRIIIRIKINIELFNFYTLTGAFSWMTTMNSSLHLPQGAHGIIAEMPKVENNYNKM